MKKILSLFVLLMTIVIGAKADDVYKFQLNGANKEIINGTTTSGALQYFSYNSSKHNFNSKFTGCTFDGVSYTNGLKMEGATQVSWTSTQTSTVTIVQSTWSDKTIKFDGTELAVSGAEAITGGRVYTISNVAAGAHSMTRGSGESGVFAIYVTEASSKTVTDITLDGVKIDGSTATETTDYTISGTTITLTGSYSIAPEVSLTEKTTYDEGDPTTKDIAVTLTKGEAYFTGSAKIGAGTDYETEYTIQVPVSTAASLEASVSSVSVTSPKVVTGTSKFTVVGANLTGSTVTLAFASAVDGLTVSPASIEVTEGAVNQEVTVSYQSNEDVSETIANLTITSAGVDAITIPVTYSSTAGVTTITDVTESTTWDFGSTGKSSDVASLDVNNLVPFANVDGWASTFNAAALTGKAQYLVNTGNKCFQGSILKFHTTVPGTIQVDFSNTGSASSSRPYRYLQVNGVVTEYKSKDANKLSTSEIAVEAGDVELIGIVGTTTGDDCEPTETQNMLRIYKVVFTADNGKEDSDLAVDPAETSVNMQETTDVTYTTSSTGAVTVESSDNTIATATVDATNKTITITGVAAGQATITVSQEADDNYNAGSKEIAVTVINPNVKTVYDVTGLTSDEFVLTKDNIGGEFGTSEDNQFVTTSVDKWNENKTYAGHTGDFFNMSTDRAITFKVKGAENFRVLVQNSTSGRSYTVKVGSAAAETITHEGAGVEASDIFETGSTDEVTITITGASSSVYPVAIQFNIPQTTINLNSKGFATYSSAYDFEFEGAEAYGMKLTATSLVGTKVTSGKIAAGEGILFKGEAGATVTITGTTGAEAIDEAKNNLIGTTNASAEIISSSYNYMYSLSGDTFLPFTGTLKANKAFFGSDTVIANSLDMVFEDEATAINNVSANEVNAVAPVKVIKNGKLYIGNYNVAGQQVK